MIRRTTSARRYAEAAFELAAADDGHDSWARDLEEAARVLGDEQVSRMLDDPTVPLREREDLVGRLLERRVARPVVNLVRLLAQRGRADLLPAISGEFRRLLNRKRGIVEAVATSAKPLSQADREAVRERVEAMTGAKVELQAEVDESLIGGLTVRVGDRLLDASIRGRLERLRHELIARGSLGR
ncbi:MAG TPA: F0F1 ATP synthase subunit delta [Candidatus Limnocylindrales bacterium]|jgi:F-type H+-transporting ATPase subunit delta|nr:F0F1 ATP synthase subunit delta [Candidatus Limnocylindrales bacterium]